MTTTQDDKLLDLARRVEEGSGNDPLLQFDISIALGWTHAGSIEGWTLPDGRHVRATPNWLGSLDAVAALAAEKLPGWDYRSGKTSTGAWAEVDNGASSLLTGTFVHVSGRASTECRARLAAILRALANVKEG